MTSTHRKQLDRIHEQMATDLRFLLDQARREAAALSGELGIDAQLIAMSAKAKAMRAAGDEAGYQAIRAEAYKIYEGSNEDGRMGL